MSIGQFARATGLSVSAVRFYANRELLQPADIDPKTSYRRYSASQVDAGRLIRDLRQLEMPLALIERALSFSPDDRQRLVDNYLDELEADVARVRTLARSLGTTDNDQEDQNMKTPETETPVATLPARTLRRALQQILPAAGTDPASPHLMTALIESKDDSVRLAATDRHRLAVRDVVPTGADADFAALVAATTATDWLSPLDVEGDVTLSVTTTRVDISGATELTAELVPATFPDYQSVLDMASPTTSATVDVPSLRAALLGQTGPVSIACHPSGVSVGDETEMPSNHRGPEQSVLLNADYLDDALAATIGNDVVLEISGSLAPLVVRSADEGTFTTLIMPIAPD